MGKNIVEKIIDAHLTDGSACPGEEIGLKIDQTLTQDATGTMAYLEYEAMGIARVQTELSVAYIDHNTLQNGYMNADDHQFIRTAAKKFGVRYSRPGNGICHQVHLERFAAPGKTLIGSDSHTPTAGGIGCLAMGAGGLDVAVAMGGGAYYISYPKVTLVRLTGTLSHGVSAKDIILEVLRRLTVKGGVGKVLEYGGDGVRTLSVPQRATITNMGAELGATSSIFPSDEVTYAFLKAQGRESDWCALQADENCHYDEVLEINLSALRPLAACPHSPDNVKPVHALHSVAVQQICIGSCTNSSYTDLMTAAAILKGRTVSPQVSLSISPGSRQVLSMLSANGALTDLLNAGARLLESACGPCIGMGQSPSSGGVSLRTFNRNFEGRSGTADAQVYLVSPETAAASALTGFITDPSQIAYEVPAPAQSYPVNDNMIDLPASPEQAAEVEIVRGPNIQPLPQAQPLSNTLTLPCLLKVGDNITTDHIMPAGSKILPYRSNIPYLSRFCFEVCDKEFAERAQNATGGFIVGGSNYGQGSSREHAALVPLYLGIRAVIAKSFARIHKANLVNAGILPLEFAQLEDYSQISLSDTLHLSDIFQGLETGRLTLTLSDKNTEIPLLCHISARQAAVLRAGGLLNYTRSQSGGNA